MLFNSLLFLVFLVVAVLGSWALLRHRALRFGFLLVASWLFYMSWDPRFIGLILLSTVVDYCAGLGIEKAGDGRPQHRKAWLWLSLISNLGLLGYFKYTNFFLQSIAGVAQAVGLEAAIPIFEITLPVGISFYTFQTLSYTIDVYRKQIPAERSFLRFALYVCFFPQLVAGPIVRASDFLPQLHQRVRLSYEDVGAGLFRIARGLVKKVVIADHLAVNLVDRAFSSPDLYSSPELLVALYGYTMQIYCDFSGYSDIAIGSARLIGYRLPENFERPYIATTVAGFWRRWHITLSGWLRHYVFFPLGGSRGGVWMAHRNTFITLILIGLWHGASWRFVLYGALHGAAISVNRVLSRRRGGEVDEFAQPWYHIIWKVALSFHFVVLARILFRAHSFGLAADYTTALFSNGWGLSRVGTATWLVLGGAYLIHWAPRRYVDGIGARFVALPAFGQGLALAGLAALVATVAETDVVPFIYFQF